MKNINTLRLIEDHFLFETLSNLGCLLQIPSEYINLSIFEVTLDQVSRNETKDSRQGGRPRLSKLVLFTEFIIQRLYNLSDDQLELKVIERSSFNRFIEAP